jgi:hypothetical protein
MNTSSLVRPVQLHRPWAVRTAERIVDAWAALAQRVQAALQRARERRREARDLEAALELSETTLRDMGAPDWLQARAESHRAVRRFERELLRVEPRPSGLRYL